MNPLLADGHARCPHIPTVRNMAAVKTLGQAFVRLGSHLSRVRTRMVLRARSCHKHAGSHRTVSRGPCGLPLTSPLQRTDTTAARTVTSPGVATLWSQPFHGARRSVPVPPRTTNAERQSRPHSHLWTLFHSYLFVFCPAFKQNLTVGFHQPISHQKDSLLARVCLFFIFTVSFRDQSGFHSGEL